MTGEVLLAVLSTIGWIVMAVFALAGVWVCIIAPLCGVIFYPEILRDDREEPR